MVLLWIKCEMTPQVYLFEYWGPAVVLLWKVTETLEGREVRGLKSLISGSYKVVEEKQLPRVSP